MEKFPEFTKEIRVTVGHEQKIVHKIDGEVDDFDSRLKHIDHSYRQRERKNSTECDPFGSAADNTQDIPKECKLLTEHTRIKPEDQPKYNIIASCVKYSETILKI